jgi:hypothetical protein
MRFVVKRSGGLRLGTIVMAGMVGLAVLGALTAEDLRRYLRIRNL